MIGPSRYGSASPPASALTTRVRYCSRVAATGDPGGVRCADVAQLVAHHLAKVRVAGSNPVVRSRGRRLLVVEWPRGEATACKAVYTGSNPVSTSRSHYRTARAISSVGEHYLDTVGVGSSILPSPTIGAGQRVFHTSGLRLFSALFGCRPGVNPAQLTSN